MGRTQARTKLADDPTKEPVVEQIASFVGFFIYLLVLKSFFLPLFVIPTGSMAETLYGEHAVHTCPNCGTEYPVGLPLDVPYVIRCPNCRWQEFAESPAVLPRFQSAGIKVDGMLDHPLHKRAGDRIMVHGWTYDVDSRVGPHRWDVVVFKVPSDGVTNYIKRLIGKPGETIEIIDGDVYAAEPGGELAIARKPRPVQESLLFPYYNQDFPPTRASDASVFHPRWVEIGQGAGWQGLQTRRPYFQGGAGDRSEIMFVTDPGATINPGLVTDIYGYNRAYIPTSGPRAAFVPFEQHAVSDVRLSCAVQFDPAASPDAFVELSTTKQTDNFFARLYSDGRVTLERAGRRRGDRERWGNAHLEKVAWPVVLALSNVDYRVSVEVDGQPVIQSTPEQYSADPDRIRQQKKNGPPRLIIAAGGGPVALAHLLIERDVYYTSDVGQGRTGIGTQDHPLTLGPNDCFVLGDNSPSSLDSRFSFVQRPDETLEAELVRSDYQRGTVPADQLIGPAFFVYWPGTAELIPDHYLGGPLRYLNQLPTPGRIRWIH